MSQQIEKMEVVSKFAVLKLFKINSSVKYDPLLPEVNPRNPLTPVSFRLVDQVVIAKSFKAETQSFPIQT
jgi:hypothetical protein